MNETPETIAPSITDAEIVELFVARVEASIKELKQSHDYAKERYDHAAKDLADAMEFIGLTPRAALTKVTNDNPPMRDMVALLEAVGGPTNLKARIGAHRLGHGYGYGFRSARMTLTWAPGANRRVALIDPVSDTESPVEYGIIADLEIRRTTTDHDGKACDIWQVYVVSVGARRYYELTDIPAVVDALTRIFGVNLTGDVSPPPSTPEVIEVTLPYNMRSMAAHVELMLTSMSTTVKVKVQKPKKAPKNPATK